MLKELLKRDYVILDGAMGTNLFMKGLTSGECPESWNIDNPKKIFEIHESFVNAGSDIIVTNTFGGNQFRLKLHQLESKVKELNYSGAQIARKSAGKKVFIAGSIGPSGEILEPLGNLKYELAVKAFGEQSLALAEGGVDMLWLETFSDIKELQAALEGSMQTGLPIVATMSFDTVGKTMMGVSPNEFVSFMEKQHNVFAYGANCGLGFDELLQTVGQMQNAGGKNVVAKSNLGIPVFHNGLIKYNTTEKSLLDYAVKARNMGALFIGGCCGTEAKHIKKVKEILKASPYEYLKYKQSNSLNRENKKPKRRRRNKIDTKKV
ncbi:MAG: methionine synthase I [Deltaproteobacteria bacterium]|jgi:5-methyltetrahydrofolate--homocysteine methyltransferase|nr:methionine synthase I [Deltaproteobacteria bacterium]RZO42808.1 MAG: betaine--homocysteine S-methyltransferase [Pseudomonadota bacterium]|tara:strand:- start:671 stop:1633 length:963 start_codon:yes stop_codon:yes gene_type:complete